MGPSTLTARAVDQFGTITISNPVNITVLEDADSDGMEDTWERQYFGSLAEEASTDFDSDGISNIFEYNHGTDPTDTDTDGDGYSDSDEYYAGTNATDFSDAPESAGVEPWNIADVGNVSGAKGYTVDGRYVLHAKGLWTLSRR